MTKRTRKRRSVVLGVGVMAGLAGTAGAVGNAAPAFANTAGCPHGTSSLRSAACYRVATKIYGAIADQTDTVLNESSADIDSGHTLWHWLYSAGSNCGTDYVTIGLVRSFTSFDTNYAHFVTSIQNGIYHAQEFGSEFASPDNTTHVYEIETDGFGDWTASYDGTGEVLFLGGIGASLCLDEAGLWVDSTIFNKASTSAVNFASSPLKWEDTGGTWHSGWNTSQLWVDHPCGGGFSPPNCLNGVYYGSSEWQANKPAQ